MFVTGAASPSQYVYEAYEYTVKLCTQAAAAADCQLCTQAAAAADCRAVTAA